MAKEASKKVAAKKPAKKTVKKASKKKEEKPVMGRPKVDPSDYNKNWKEDALKAYADGKSNAWVKVRCFNGHVISSDLWYRWMDEDVEDFSSTINHGNRLSQAWWEDVSQDHACGVNADANATSLIFNMSNRFKDSWKQRQTVEQSSKLSLDLDEAEKLADFLKDHGIDPSTL